MPREPAYAAERSQDGEAKAASERAKNRMFVASVRLSGHGQPRPTPEALHRQPYCRSAPVSSTAMKAFCGMSTEPMLFIRFLPSFCFAHSFFFREMSPP